MQSLCLPPARLAQGFASTTPPSASPARRASHYLSLPCNPTSRTRWRSGIRQKAERVLLFSSHHMSSSRTSRVQLPTSTNSDHNVSEAEEGRSKHSQEEPDVSGELRKMSESKAKRENSGLRSRGLAEDGGGRGGRVTGERGWDHASTVRGGTGARKLMHIKEARRGGGMVFYAIAMACCGSLSFGYHISVINASLRFLLRDLNTPDDPLIGGWIVSVLLAAATVGALTGGALADRFGRRRAFQLASIPLLIGSALSATAASVGQMVVGRGLVGWGVGIVSCLVPLFISEVSPTEMRGRLGTMNQLATSFGVLLALLMGLPLSSHTSWWRVMFGAGLLPPLLMLISFSLFVPESPRWLFNRKREEEAHRSAVRLYGQERAEREMEGLRGSQAHPPPLSVDAAGAVAAEELKPATWTELFSPRYRTALTIGSLLFALQQFAGINAVVYFSSVVFHRAGVHSDVAASALVGLLKLAAVFMASAFADQAGRTQLLLISYAGMGCSMGFLGLSSSVSFFHPHAGIAAVVGTVLYVMFFSFGAGSMTSLLLPEIFPARIRANGVAFCMLVHWVCNFMVGFLFLRIMEAIGVGPVYFAFGAVCFLAAFFVHRFVPETKGISLEELERILGR